MWNRLTPLLALLLVSLPSYAQSPGARILGTVTDSSGAVIPCFDSRDEYRHWMENRRDLQRGGPIRPVSTAAGCLPPQF